ncbi:hypothetical protein [Enterobacter ludwigii]|uniref:hypothetical protein n=1 Tax=Enterobacter ludwigii TaxID=299767 RepID=UPI00273E453B|nr:hypothetical protein [Enterobacter ludwigii]MDP5163572.1 hypothetical protein [Enterobacter ludwigii]
MKKIYFIAASMFLFANSSKAIEFENSTSVSKPLVFTATTPPLSAEIQLNQNEFAVGNAEKREVGKLILSTPGFFGIYKTFKWAETQNQVSDNVDVHVFERNDANKSIHLSFESTDGNGITALGFLDNTLDGDWLALGYTDGVNSTFNTDMVQNIAIVLNTPTEVYHAGVYPITIDVATFKL